MKKIFKIDKDALKKVVYHPDLSSANSYVNSVNEQLVEEMVERENRMLEEAIEYQRAKKGNRFKKFLAEFKHMKPEEQNTVIYSFTDLLKRMHEIHDDSVAGEYNEKMRNLENQWWKYKEESKKEPHDD